VRMPAGACGIVGFKPAIGAVSVEGVFPLVPSFDTVGPMARTVADCALAYAVLTGTPVPEPGMRGLRVGLLTSVPDLAPVTSAAPRDDRALAYAERLRALGAEVQEAVLPTPEGDTWPVFNAEAARSHAATFPSRRDEYGPTIRAKLDGALLVTDADHQAGLAALHAWRAQAAREPAVDLLVSPTLGVEELPPAGVDELDVRLAVSAYTRPFSYLGWPAIAIGGLQIVGRDAATVIAAALAVEYQGNW
jgi:Asp-tRNA(Asn)/Glu-tRNA(Gln) amidotransferase A subunit family amidase